jgi:hypothetical protein
MTNEQVLQVIDRRLASKRISAALVERLFSKRDRFSERLYSMSWKLLFTLLDAVLRLAARRRNSQSLKSVPTLERQVYLIDRRVRLGKLSPALLSQLLAMREVLVRRADAEFESQADDSTLTAAQQQVLRKLTGKALISQRETFRVEAQRKAHREALAALAKSPTTPKQVPIAPQPTATNPGMTHEQVREYLEPHTGTAPGVKPDRIRDATLAAIENLFKPEPDFD